MPRYIALLRGINVGKAKRVAMSDLRALLENLGYESVATLLMSGNAVFTASGATSKLAEDIEAAIARELKMKVSVIVLTAAELAKIIKANPLEVVDPSRFVVTFVSGTLKKSSLPDVAGPEYEPDEICITPKAIYTWHPNGITGSSKPTQDLSRHIGMPHTARNWNTVTKLLNMAQAEG